MFKKYIDVERLGKEDCEGILTNAFVYCFPKLDGANGSVWIEKDPDTQIVTLCCGSRNNKLDSSNTNKGFYTFVQENQEKFLNLFTAHPSWTLFGEWLVPHTVKNYREEMWKQFYVFDVYDRDLETYVHYQNYQPELELWSVNHLLPVAVVDNPTVEVLSKDNVLGEALRFGVKEGTLGEGMVIKNYRYRNKYGHYVQGKIVRQEFKELTRRAPKIEGPRTDENDFVETYLTRGRIEKLLAKLQDLDKKTRIPRFLETLWYELVTEEMYDFVKKGRKTMDFSKLKSLVFAKAKVMTPELFGKQIVLSQETCKTEEQNKTLEELFPQEQMLSSKAYDTKPFPLVH